MKLVKVAGKTVKKRESRRKQQEKEGRRGDGRGKPIDKPLQVQLIETKFLDDMAYGRDEESVIMNKVVKGKCLWKNSCKTEHKAVALYK